MIDNEVPIATVDVCQLSGSVPWPFMRVLARHFVEQVALHHEIQALLDTHTWSSVRAVPRPDQQHVYDLFGVPYRTAI